MSSHVLVVEDDPTLAGMLRLYLEKEGYRVIVAADGAAGLAAAQTARPDLMILDVMLPRMDGWEVCRQVRAHSRMPIILLTALDQEQHKVQGLDLGADDYVTKPFSMRELMARVRARLRHPPAEAAAHTELLEFPGLRIDPGARTVTVAGQAVDLTPKEFDLLVHLARAAGRVLTRGDLVQRVWQYPMGSDDRTLHTHMLRLRRKLGVGGRNFLHTVWGVGYKFEASP